MLNLQLETPSITTYPLLQPLLYEFKHVFPAEIPPGLPPERINPT